MSEALERPAELLPLLYLLLALGSILLYALTLRRRPGRRRTRPEMVFASLGLLFLANLCADLEGWREVLASLMLALLLCLIILNQWVLARQERAGPTEPRA